MSTPDDQPNFIAETDVPMPTVAARIVWFRERAEEAKGYGCTFFRYAFHPDDSHRLLVEGWVKQPNDQGKLRWGQLSPTNPGAP